MIRRCILIKYHTWTGSETSQVKKLRISILKEVGKMHEVIIDCDPGIDDCLALLYALKSPQLQVKAICVVCGNVPTKIGVRNVFHCLAKCNRLDILVYVGADQPLVVDFTSAQDTHGMDGLGESQLASDVVDMPIQSETAPAFYARIFAQPTQLSVIALGPLTNIALALELNPSIGSNMQRFVSMGGAYLSHGNCSPVAEYNYWCDPHAARAVYQNLNQTIEMVGLDVTREIVFTPNLLSYCQYVQPEMGTYLARLVQFYFDFHWQQEHILGCVINDPLAVAYFIQPQLCEGFTTFVDVETQGIARGQTLVDRHHFWQKKANAKVLTKVLPDQFFIQFLSVLLDAPASVIAEDLKLWKIG